ncbi:MAG: Gfo/Idh/MocA family oxidoreductase [Candidatus Omnitrophica bacterium]|nr:Gfo/Idh/MocA family oxidoreductase [Candidatus Omnitrophota bacterium]
MQKNTTLNRRQFSKLTAAAMAASAPAVNVLGANDKIQLGFIGQGGRGSHHFRQFLGIDDVRIASLCDAYLPNAEKNAEQVGHPVQKTQDFRDVLDNKDVDAVVIASPDHWHALQAIYACQAGKDIYVEKPMSRTIVEGRRLIQAAEKYKRVVQVGQQQRSSEQFQKAVEMVKNGEIGHVTSARCINMWNIDGYLSPKGKHGIGVFPDAEPPEGLDYDMWLGPAPKRSFNPNRFRVNFYFYLDYSGGMLTAWGVHLFDIVLWAMGPELKAACCMGGKYAHDDDRDTPDTAEAVWDAPGYTFSYTLRHGNGFPYEMECDGIDHGIYFYGDKATILVNRRYLKIFSEKDRKNPTVIPAKGGDLEHKRNWLDCIRSRKDPVCTPKEGHEANVAGLLALIAWQVGREIKFDYQNEKIIGDSEANRLLTRKYRKSWQLPKVV